MTRTYGVPVASVGRQTTDAAGDRPSRRQPNWWVILAVSLALIALLVQTSGRDDTGGPLHVQTTASTRDTVTHHPAAPKRSRELPTSSTSTTSTTTTTTTTGPLLVPSSVSDQTRVAVGHARASTDAPPSSTTVTTTPAAPTTTTTAASPAAQAADRTQTEGYLDPPVQSSGVYAVSGSGPTNVSVLWSTPVYLTMTVACPDGSQSVGGTTAMDVSLTDASSGCQATVYEPSSESTSLAYTVTIGPAGG